MSQAGDISDIPKTMIFVDKIEERLKMIDYPRSLLPEFMCKKGDQIIQIFYPTKNFLDNSYS